MSVTEIIDELQDAMLYFENIERFSKDICFEDKLEESKKNYKESKNNKMSKKDDESIIPEYKDKLFWIFYILNKGLSNYTLIFGNNFKEENDEKIHLVEKVRKNKDFLKKNKWKRSSIETNLVGEKMIDINTFFCICGLHNINVILIKNKCLFEFVNISFNTKIYVINYLEENKYSLAYEAIDLQQLEVYRNKYWIIENLAKPLKGISSYKVKDLVEITEKLGLKRQKNINGKEKNLTKKEMYMNIMECL
tara:strand:+ start:1812 stop:2561 length:750 start_codon:yes stop_codon:yes gene_type:complete